MVVFMTVCKAAVTIVRSIQERDPPGWGLHHHHHYHHHHHHNHQHHPRDRSSRLRTARLTMMHVPKVRSISGRYWCIKSFILPTLCSLEAAKSAPKWDWSRRCQQQPSTTMTAQSKSSALGADFCRPVNNHSTGFVTLPLGRLQETATVTWQSGTSWGQLRHCYLAQSGHNSQSGSQRIQPARALSGKCQGSETEPVADLP